MINVSKVKNSPRGRELVSTIFTGCNEVVPKVMFFTGVCHSVDRGGVCLSACWDTTPPPGADPPGADTGIRSMSGRYASY